MREARRIDLKGRIKIYDENLAIINSYLRNIEPDVFTNQ